MQAIVLSRRDWREYDQLVTLYTRESGKVDVLARGVKKSISKNAAYLESFFLIEADIVPGKDRSHLTKVVPLQCFEHIPESLEAMQLLGYSLLLVNEMVSIGESDPALFDLLHEWLIFLNSEPAPALASSDIFILKLWGRLGFIMALDACVVCGAVEQRAIYPAGGGVVCTDCATAKRAIGEIVVVLSPADFVLLKTTLREPFTTSVGQLVGASPAWHQAIMAFVAYHSPRPIPIFQSF